jgi:hypothetical protein
LSNKPHETRRTLLEIFRKLRHDRDVLVRTVAEQQAMLQKQRDFIREQQAAYRELYSQIDEIRRGQTELRELAVRYGLVCKAADAKREEGSPLQ